MIKKGLPVHVRDLVNLSMDQLWKMKGVYEVTFDDDVTLTLPSRYIKLSWPYWGLTRFYSEVPVPSTLCYNTNMVAKDRHHLEFMGQAARLAQKKDIPLEKIRWTLLKEVYTVAYNNTVGNLMSCMTTMDYDNFIEIYDHPNVQAAHALIRKYPTGKNEDGDDMIDKAFCLIEEAFRDPMFVGNEFIQSIVNESLSTNQGLQAYLRGPMSEINSTIYDNLVGYGFFGGLLDLTSVAKESIAASRSHLFNKDNIADAEYGSRKYQLVGNVIMRHFKDDCGTEHSHKYTFEETVPDRERFKSMVGMYYRLNNGKKGEWVAIEKGDFEKLIGKEIEFRTAMCCKKLRKQGICRVCFGRLYYNTSRKASPGHLAYTSTASKGSQGILSTKHLDFLRILESLIISPTNSMFLERFKHKTTRGVKLKSRIERFGWEKNNTYLELTPSVVSEISQLRWRKNLTGLDETSLSEVQSLTFVQRDEEGVCMDTAVLDMQMGTCGNFSRDFIKYCVSNRQRLISVGKNSLLPLDRWDVSKLFVVYSNRSESMAEFVSALESKIRSNASGEGEERIDRKVNDTLLKRGGKTYNLVEFGGGTEESCTHALFDMQQFINRKLKGVPMAHLGIILAASRVESWTNPYPAVGFDQPGANTGKRFVDHNTLIGLRSAPCMFFFEKQRTYMESFQMYTDRERPESAFDTAFIIPPDYDV